MSDIAQKPRGLRALYAWMLKNAQGRNAWAAVAAFAFAEASFFPIPRRCDGAADDAGGPQARLPAWRPGCAFWSVTGGMLGYAIGALFWETAGLWLIHLLHVPLARWRRCAPNTAPMPI